LVAVAAMPVELRAEGPIHRAIEAQWRRFFRPLDAPRAMIGTRFFERRRVHDGKPAVRPQPARPVSRVLAALRDGRAPRGLTP
jgi:hypothetical protein